MLSQLPKSKLCSLTLEARCILCLSNSITCQFYVSCIQNSDIKESSETQRSVSPVVEQPLKKRMKEKPSVPDPDGKVKVINAKERYTYML